MTIMSKQEHPDLSDIEWDPTGRYVTSYVNLWNAKVGCLQTEMWVDTFLCFN